MRLSRPGTYTYASRCCLDSTQRLNARLFSADDALRLMTVAFGKVEAVLIISADEALVGSCHHNSASDEARVSTVPLTLLVPNSVARNNLR